MNKEVRISSAKDDDDEGVGADPSTFNPDAILTNTAVEEEIKEKVDSEPPTEAYIMSKTMWPEKNKWYGHAYEIFALATSPNGKWIASSCKAKEAKYAEIYIWTLDNLNPVHKIDGHRFTAV